VEKSLKELFGLNAQIFRNNADGSFTQTNLSDHLTLREKENIVLDASVSSNVPSIASNV
jgi:hypothetical protein